MSWSLFRVSPDGRVAGLGGLGLALAAVVLVGCSQERRLEPEIETHPAEWNEPASAEFHGDYVMERTAVSCASCHGTDLDGTSTAPSCSDCHAGAGGHPFGYVSAAGDAFHGRDVEATGPAPCMQCHGETYRGGWSETSCFTCHAGGPSGHPDGWLTPASASFHGRVVLNQGYDDCRRCHGQGLGGGTSGLACSECHG